MVRYSYLSTIVCLVLYFTLLMPLSAMSANRSDKKAPKKSTVRFHRGLQKKAGKGGFAYNGMRKEYLIEDTLLAAIESAPQNSAWFDSEKEFYLKLMKNRSFDVLVVPFQTQLDGVDPIGRSLMSYRLAAEIERQTHLRVVPLPIVHFAMGSHSRFYEDASIYSIAKQMGVSHIVWGYAGTHEDKVGHIQSLDITMIYQKKEVFVSPEGSRCKSWTGIDLTANRLPSLIFEEKLAEIMSFIDFPGQKIIKENEDGNAKSPSMPLTPEVLFSIKSNDPITNSYYYQFMGMLIPPRAEFHRQYMFIRSLTALIGADKNHPDYAVLTARAYHHLNRRPAAVEALQKEDSDKARLLMNMINGNLQPLNSVDSLLASPTMDGFFATVEYAWLMYRYTRKLPTQGIRRWVKKYPDWAYFFELIANEHNPWDVPINWELNQVLEKVYPVNEFTVKRLANKLLTYITSERADVELNMLYQDHLWESMSLRSDRLFDGFQNCGPSTFDHHIMFEGIGISNLLKRLNFLSNVQSLPEASMNLSADYLKHYQGHPYFTIMHAKIQNKSVRTLQGEKRQNMVDQSVTDAILGLWWYGRQGWAFPKARSVLKSRLSAKSKLLTNIISHKYLLYGIASDYPFIPESATTGFMRLSVDLLDWSTWHIGNLDPTVSIYRNDKEMLNLIKEKVKGRFIGHPNRYHLEMAMESASDANVDKKTLYHQEIDRGSENWKIYRYLGRMYAREGDYQNAAKVLWQYPEFSDKKSKNRVSLSNKAYMAGSLFFWRGAYHEARQFYEYSANLNTGSGAGLTSRARVALLDRDFKASRKYMLKSAQRYDTSYRYRDFMSLSHLLDDSQNAWKQFSDLLGRYSYPHIWTSALVGHHINATTKDELKHWINDTAAQNQTSRQRSFSARFAFMCLVDRSPDMEMAKFVETVDDLGKYDFTNRKSIKGPEGNHVGPEFFGRLRHYDFTTIKYGTPEWKRELEKAKKKYYEVDILREPFSFYGSLALAYENLKNKNYDASYDILKKQSYLYAYDREFGEPVKSFLVWAGVNSGKEKELESLLSGALHQVGIKEYPGGAKGRQEEVVFDDELSLAAYLCGMGNNDKAVERMKQAFLKRPHTEKRPLFSKYQIVELCEWFYEHSNDSRYLELALKWSKDYQIIQPMFGWAYAFEAKYTRDAQGRMRALGYALFLDPQSWRIAHFSDAQKKAASKWFAKNGDFKK